MSFLTLLTSNRPGKHRLHAGRDQHHVGWEGPHAQELGNLKTAGLKSYAGRWVKTTVPPPGRPGHDVSDIATTLRCPLDGCQWPHGVYDDPAQVPPHHADMLLEHVRGHVPQDVIRTCNRHQGVIAELRTQRS
jgi:hypothetical protein